MKTEDIIQKKLIAMVEMVERGWLAIRESRKAFCLRETINNQKLGDLYKKPNKK